MSAPPSSRLRKLGFLRRLAPRLRAWRGRLAWSAVLIVLTSGISLAFPLVVRELLDAAFLAGDGRALDRIALLLLGLFAVQAILHFAQS